MEPRIGQHARLAGSPPPDMPRWAVRALYVAGYSGFRNLRGLLRVDPAHADPPSDDFVCRNSGDAQQIEIGWWLVDRDHDRPAFFALPIACHSLIQSRTDSARLTSSSMLCCHTEIASLRLTRRTSGRGSSSPRSRVAHSAFRRASTCCEWDPILAASAEGSPPPVR
jgi:hypothetical protein